MYRQHKQCSTTVTPEETQAGETLERNPDSLGFFSLYLIFSDILYRVTFFTGTSLKSMENLS